MKVFCAFQMSPDPDQYPAETLIAIFQTKEALLTIYPKAIEKNRDDVKATDLWDGTMIIFEEFEVFSEPPKTTEPNGTIVEWGGKKMRVGRCLPGNTCLACDRLGYHLEPVTDALDRIAPKED